MRQESNPLKQVRIYTTPWCWYCRRAKEILDQHQVAFQEIDVTGDREERQRLLEVTGRRTVPQIFFGEEPIGGCDDLEALVRAGRLMPMLTDSAGPTGGG
jgi:glutaredoxin 3